MAGLEPKEFWCPGSTLRVRFDNTHPLAYGMPAEGLVLFIAARPSTWCRTDFNDRKRDRRRYADRDLLQSGWLNRREVIAKKAAMASVGLGQGKVVLIGFRTQHRAQTHGTYKFLFNALVNAPGGQAPRTTPAAAQQQAR